MCDVACCIVPTLHVASYNVCRPVVDAIPAGGRTVVRALDGRFVMAGRDVSATVRVFATCCSMLQHVAACCSIGKQHGVISGRL